MNEKISFSLNALDWTICQQSAIACLVFSVKCITISKMYVVKNCWKAQCACDPQ